MTEDTLLLAKKYFNLGLESLESGKASEAENHFRQALGFYPGRPSILANLSSALLQQGKCSEALFFNNELLNAEPNNFEGHINLGICLLKTGKQEEAISAFDAAIAINSESPKGWVNKGNILLERGMLTEAKTYLETGLQLDSQSVDALIGLSNLHNELEDYAAGLEYLSRAHKKAPNNHLIQWNKALSLLRLGNFKEGWQLYESRWQVEGMRNYIKHQDIPLWLGKENLSNKTILIYSEQGYGDAIQMSRFLPLLVKEKGAKIVFEVPLQLKELMRSLGHNIQVIENGGNLPNLSIDFQCPIMSLPLAFKITSESIPKQIPYLYAEEQKKKFWQEKLESISRQNNISQKPYRIGITWRGSGHYAGIKNLKRDAPLSLMYSIADLLSKQPLEFHAIQKNGENEHHGNENRNFYCHQENLNTFADTAALISELDLVISVDTAVGHLAGALGKDALVLIPKPPDFMSQTGINKSPWYPNIEFIRQIERGIWEKELVARAIMNHLSLVQ